MIDIDTLEALAKAATPGEWVSYTPIGAALNPWEATFVAGPIPRYMDRSQGFCPADGNYIGAANPQVVLALIAEVRALRADAARLDFLIDNDAHVWSMGLGWHVTTGHSDDPQNLEPWDAHCESAREAIDAARGAK
jgi:hypothetical protein